MAQSTPVRSHDLHDHMGLTWILRPILFAEEAQQAQYIGPLLMVINRVIMHITHRPLQNEQNASPVSTILIANIIPYHVTPISQFIACWVGARFIAPVVSALHDASISYHIAPIPQFIARCVGAQFIAPVLSAIHDTSISHHTHSTMNCALYRGPTGERRLCMQNA